jgi:hypothetical protein
MYAACVLLIITLLVNIAGAAISPEPVREVKNEQCQHHRIGLGAAQS